MAVEFSPGAIVGKRFRLERCLGSGGMGTVWSAIHDVTRRRHALKFLRPQTVASAEMRSRFMREARAAASIDHPNVVKVHDFFEHDDGTLVMVLDLLEGETLGQRLSRERCLRLEDAAVILRQVATAVGAAHAAGIVHRDLKPDNVFLCAGEPLAACVRVLDFGVAKLSVDEVESPVLTRTGAIVGTPAYMAPEQLFGEKDIGPEADLWAIGVMLYETLSGARPVEGENIGQVVKRLMNDAITPLEALVDVPDDVRVLGSRLLSKEREGRPRNAREVADVLQRHVRSIAATVQSHTPSSAAASTSVTGDALPLEPRPHRALSLGAGLVLAAALGVALQRSRTGDDAASPSPVDTAPLLTSPSADSQGSPPSSLPAMAETPAEAPVPNSPVVDAGPPQRVKASRVSPSRARARSVSAPPRETSAVEPASPAASAARDTRRGLVEDPPF